MISLSLFTLPLAFAVPKHTDSYDTSDLPSPVQIQRRDCLCNSVSTRRFTFNSQETLSYVDGPNSKILDTIPITQPNEDDSLAVSRYRKHVWIAATLEFCVPMAGNIYAGNINKAMPPLLLSISGYGAILGGGVLMVDLSDVPGSGGAPRVGQGIALLGLGMIIGGKFWRVAESINGVERYNKKHNLTLRPSIVPTNHGIAVAVAFP